LAGIRTEELFFRGYVQTRLCARFGGWPGVIVTAALFGFLHLDWSHSPSAFVIGLFLGWLARCAGSIRPGLLAHAVNNTLWALATWAHFGARLPPAAHGVLLALYGLTIVLAIKWLRPRLDHRSLAEELDAMELPADA
jgi:membrane protease YdiL (CAAX protease family)